MTRIGFIIKPKRNDEARTLLHRLVEWASAQGHSSVVMAEDRVNPPGATLVPQSDFADAVDMCVVLGGDGTILRASSATGDREVPLLGINLGRLGFLSPFDPGTAVESLRLALEGKLETRRRMRLDVRYIAGQGSSGDNAQSVIARSALNEVVISQGAMARLVDLKAYHDGTFISSYRADGLVVSTPTGSTAYNLAAGGPIMVPGLNALALTPICAHGLTNRPLVLPSTGTVEVSVQGESKGVVLTVDGQWARSFQQGDRVAISASPKALVVYRSETDYFNILRSKLHWGVSPSK